MSDPFNAFLQSKLATFRNRLISRINYRSLFIKEITEGRIPLARTVLEAHVLRRPASPRERERMSEEELDREDKRLYERAVIMTESKIQEEVERLFEA